MFAGLHVKYPLFLLEFKETRIFRKDFRKILKCQISIKSAQKELPFFSPCGQKGERMERRAEMTKITVAFRNFAKSPKKEAKICS